MAEKQVHLKVSVPEGMIPSYANFANVSIANGDILIDFGFTDHLTQQIVKKSEVRSTRDVTVFSITRPAIAAAKDLVENSFSLDAEDTVSWRQIILSRANKVSPRF